MSQIGIQIVLALMSWSLSNGLGVVVPLARYPRSS